MDFFSGPLLHYLPAYGPWLLFALAVLETSFITGFLSPSGLATSVATVLALEGQLSMPQVVSAAFAGGAVGDSVGYWIGRVSGDRLLPRSGPWARVLGHPGGEVSGIFGRHPVYSVTLARLLSFVRTVMPMAAGMGRVPYRRFLRYEVVGLALWTALYVGIGAAGRESWIMVTHLVGVGGGVAFVALVTLVWVTFRRRQRKRRAARMSP